MNNTMNEINLEAMSMVSGGSMYSVDESVFGVQEFIEKCKTERKTVLHWTAMRHWTIFTISTASTGWMTDSMIGARAVQIRSDSVSCGL